MDDGYHQEGTVFDRLVHYASRLVEKKQMWQQMASKPVDPATGQELFTPVTGRKPKYDVCGVPWGGYCRLFLSSR